jgi:hypothetical protein
MYVDDILSISCDARSILEEIQGTFKYKNGKIENPQFYLGAKLQMKYINGVQCWTITSQDYVKAAVRNIGEALKKSGRRLPTSNIDTPMNITFARKPLAGPQLISNSPPIITQTLSAYQITPSCVHKNSQNSLRLTAALTSGLSWFWTIAAFVASNQTTIAPSFKLDRCEQEHFRGVNQSRFTFGRGSADYTTVHHGQGC